MFLKDSCTSAIFELSDSFHGLSACLHDPKYIVTHYDIHNSDIYMYNIQWNLCIPKYFWLLNIEVH